MFPKQDSFQNAITYIQGTPYKKQVILADANIPYKLSIDRNTNNLFFCINADEFSDQSFQSAVIDLDTGVTSVIPSIRNGFASAVDNTTSTVYLGGSNGIFKYSYTTNDVKKPAIVNGMDIFDMYFHRELYFVDTANQNLYVYRNHKKSIIPDLKGSLIHHFVMNSNDDLIFISSSGFYIMPKGARSPILCDHVSRDINFRGATTDIDNTPYFIAQDGIYTMQEHNKQLVKVLAVENGYGLAFDKDNNIIYSDERSVIKLAPCDDIII